MEQSEAKLNNALSSLGEISLNVWALGPFFHA